MKQFHYSRKRRQLKLLSDRLQSVLNSRCQESAMQIEKLILKIKRLINELLHVFSPNDLKKILGGAAVFMGFAFTNPIAAQSFGPPQTNPFGLISITYGSIPTFADLDGDGDIDLLVGAYGAQQYFENTGSAINPQFAAPQQNPFGIVTTIYTIYPAFTDLDGDGDLDLVLGEFGEYGNIQYFQNTGSVNEPQFAAPQKNPFGLVATYYSAIPTFADLDGDGDMDLLVGEYEGAMQYFQNTGSVNNPQFAAPQQNPFGLVSTYYSSFPAFSDLDGDGDTDLLVGEYEGAMQYFQNTGSVNNPQFAAPQQNPFGLVSTYIIAVPAFADLDGDGDLDLLVGEYYGKMKYFENTSPLGIQQLTSSFEVVLYPNPAKEIINIKTNGEISQIEIFNTLGKLVTSFTGSSSAIDINNLNSGSYIMKLTDSKANLITKRFQKY